MGKVEEKIADAGRYMEEARRMEDENLKAFFLGRLSAWIEAKDVMDNG